ncbi:hypothetical protein AmDm5_1860 [Acetobacter malorum]|uniref:Uncharacterized protein n=1 Tax=Acetobacter malorum TaxID=178901 RepID=A0A087PKF5_9PROT|nr:hypothetical protein [Acetobacter malorum]KFL87858.1 hypothetical protein AmDm5_1860 [Acetobacter malorum]OAG75960.1 hypothetical protein Amal_01730 [Acetobacter malorum]
MAIFEEYLNECRNVVARRKLPRLSREQAADLFSRIMEAVPVEDVVDRARQLFLARFPSWAAGATTQRALERWAGQKVLA